MSFDVTALAQAGAATIVAAMATDGWTQVRVGVARLLGRGGDAQERAVRDELEDAHAAVEAARTDDDVRDAQVGLGAVLRARLRSDADLAQRFAAFVDEVRAELGVDGPIPTITQRATADRGGTVVQSGRDSVIGRPPGPPGRRQ